MDNDEVVWSEYVEHLINFYGRTNITEVVPTESFFSWMVGTTLTYILRITLIIKKKLYCLFDGGSVCEISCNPV
jgi:hypothetical protein